MAPSVHTLDLHSQEAFAPHAHLPELAPTDRYPVRNIMPWSEVSVSAQEVVQKQTDPKMKIKTVCKCNDKNRMWVYIKLTEDNWFLKVSYGSWCNLVGKEYHDLTELGVARHHHSFSVTHVLWLKQLKVWGSLWMVWQLGHSGSAISLVLYFWLIITAKHPSVVAAPLAACLRFACSPSI